jgi:hypothetical protein
MKPAGNGVRGKLRGETAEKLRGKLRGKLRDRRNVSRVLASAVELETR